jgi:putative transposase
MARRARLVLPDVPLHIIQRGNNRHACFVTETDYRVYLSMLHVAAQHVACDVHAYVLMTNHVHLLVSPSAITSPALLMKAVGQRYTQYVNRRYGRTGTLWEGRFRSGLVEGERYLLTCQRYIELNPVRAGMVSQPDQYQWSSYRTNADGVRDELIKPHELYRRLGSEPLGRQAAYRELFAAEMAPETIAWLRRATNGNYALGDASFLAHAQLLLGRSVSPPKRKIGYKKKFRKPVV